MLAFPNSDSHEKNEQQKHWIVALKIARNVLHLKWCHEASVSVREKYIFKWWTGKKNEWKNFGYKTHWMRINVKMCVSDKSIHTFIHTYRVCVCDYSAWNSIIATFDRTPYANIHCSNTFNASKFPPNTLFPPDDVSLQSSKNHQFVVYTPLRISMKNFLFYKNSGQPFTLSKKEHNFSDKCLLFHFVSFPPVLFYLIFVFISFVHLLLLLLRNVIFTLLFCSRVCNLKSFYAIIVDVFILVN